MARKKEIAALREALKKVDALIAAAHGDESTCAVFDSHNGEFTERQKDAVRLYVDSWIREPLAAALRGIEGDRSFNNESLLESNGGHWYRLSSLGASSR